MQLANKHRGGQQKWPRPEWDPRRSHSDRTCPLPAKNFGCFCEALNPPGIAALDIHPLSGVGTHKGRSCWVPFAMISSLSLFLFLILRLRFHFIT